jgi:hypothetical protein
VNEYEPRPHPLPRPPTPRAWAGEGPEGPRPSGAHAGYLISFRRLAGRSGPNMVGEPGTGRRTGEAQHAPAPELVGNWYQIG